MKKMEGNLQPSFPVPHYPLLLLACRLLSICSLLLEHLPLLSMGCSYPSFTGHLSSGRKSFLILEGQGRAGGSRSTLEDRAGQGQPSPCPALPLAGCVEVTPPLVSNFSISEADGLDSARSDMCRWLWCGGSAPGSPSLPSGLSPPIRACSLCHPQPTRWPVSRAVDLCLIQLCVPHSIQEVLTKTVGWTPVSLEKGWWPCFIGFVPGVLQALMCLLPGTASLQMRNPGNRAGVEMTAELGTQAWSPQSLGSFSSTCSWGPEATWHGAWRSLSPSSAAWLEDRRECTAVLTQL